MRRESRVYARTSGRVDRAIHRTKSSGHQYGFSVIDGKPGLVAHVHEFDACKDIAPFDHWPAADGPAVDRRIVDRYAPLFHQLFDVPVAQRIGRAPIDADQDDVDRETHAFETKHD